jgi:macrolide transport system ATP-binding/permease protein
LLKNQSLTVELLKLENITKTYHLGEIDVPVLKGISFSVQRGELVALMGASGSGKSTLMNVLGCLDRPTSGKYWLDGQDISRLSPNERALVRTSKLGFVFQSFNLLSRTTALNNVLMPLDYSNGTIDGAAIEHARELLTRVGLADRMDHVPSQMSGGQQQRVAIARSLVNNPQLLLADEPTGNLDSHTSGEILEMFQQLNASGLTVMLVTHDPKVAAYADRVIRVVDGLIVEDDHGGRTINVGVNPQIKGPHSHGSLANGLATNGSHARRSKDDSGGGVATLVAPQRVANQPTKIETSAMKSPARRSPALSFVPAPFRTALTALRRNKMRSALTALGVIIGVAAVIAMVEISQGSRTSLMQTMSTMGANNIMVRSGAAASGGISFGQGSLLTLTPGDAEDIATATAIEAAAPVLQIQGQVVYGNRNWIPMSTQGTTPAFLRVRDWETLEEGEMFTDRDVRNANKVCVVGSTLVRELFDGQSPIGQNLRVKNVSLRVVGVLGRKGSNMMGMDQDDVLIAPWTTIKYRIADNSAAATATASTATSATSQTVNSLSELYPGSTALYPQQSATQAANTPQPVRFTNVDQITVKARSAANVSQAMDEITAILRQRHRIRPGQPDDFNLRDMSEMVKAMGSMSEMMGGLLLIVALISLVVGGVGIMNIMLVSVTERTREIGLRMAVGARGYHILRQFLIEAIVLCVAGGAIGILIGRTASFAVWYFLRWPIAASLPAIAAAFLVSATIGVAFGFYPAWKASRMDPIEALRYE